MNNKLIIIIFCGLFFVVNSTFTDIVERINVEIPISNTTFENNYIINSVIFDSDLHKGWPVYLATPSAGFPYTPTLFDADGDGDDEIFLTGGHTFALYGDGTFIPGWPTSEMIYMGYGTNGNMPGPSVADVNLDNNTEILWSCRDWYAGSAHLWCFNGKNFDGSNMVNFPQTAPDQSSNALNTPFILADSDGDDYLEAWGAHTLGNTGIHYRVTAVDHLGTQLFTVDLDTSENVENLYFGDLNGDGNKEVFAISWLSPSEKLYVFESDGSQVSGYPITLHTYSSGNIMLGPPIPVDLDYDGDLEIILGYWNSSGSYALCYHHDGSPYSGFPITIASSSQLFYMGLGDINGDSIPELLAFDNFLGSDYRLHVLDINSGLPISGFPYSIPNWPKGFPAIADITGDSVQDICFVTDGGELYALTGDGQLISGYPKTMTSGSISGVAVGDIDGDGLFELVCATWDGWVYAWDTPAPAYSDMTDWPMRGINARNTGIFGSDKITGIEEDHPIQNNTYLSIKNNINIGNNITFHISNNHRNFSIDIYDIRGCLVTTLNSNGQNNIVWNVSSYSSGIYFAKLRDILSDKIKFEIIN